MILDFRSLADGFEFDADLCIIGAGAAGIALALEFLHSKHRVVLLEGGGEQYEADTQDLYEGESVGIPFDGLSGARQRVFGGTTSIWGGQLARLDEVDLEKRPWVPYSGWPLTHAELLPFYQRAEALFGLKSVVYDESLWRRLGVEPLPLSDDCLSTRFHIHTRKLHFGRIFRKRLQSSRNVLVLLHANAVSLETNSCASAMRSVHFRTLEGKSGSIRAQAFAICCGGIESARLLLISREIEQNGLGNGYGLVRRFFREHVRAYSAEIEPKHLGALQDVCTQRYRNGLALYPKLPLSPQLQRQRATLNCTSQLVFEYPYEDSLQHTRVVAQSLRRGDISLEILKKITSLMRDAKEMLPAAWRRYALGRAPSGRPKRIRLACFSEQAPNPESRVTLSHERDRLGLNRCRIDWRMNELERSTFQMMTEAVANEFKRLGVGRVQPEAWLNEAGEGWKSQVMEHYHHMGTTRMSTSPREGVVDINCRVHTVDGLYVCSSSVFPTSGYANPTLTILALAMRLADHLKERVFGVESGRLTVGNDRWPSGVRGIPCDA